MEGSLVAYKVFTNGSVLQASEVNENLMQQAVATFSSPAARTAAITSPLEGQVSFLQDSNLFSIYDGSSWKTSLAPTGGILQVVRTTTSTLVSSTLSTYVDTGLTATITPKSASSQILVFVNQNGSVKNPTNITNSVFLRLVLPDSTDEEFYKFLGYTATNSQLYVASASYMAIYSPNAVTSQTFKTQFRSNVAGQRADVQADSSISSMTLMEVAN
jgi:hypothetical protein